MHRLLKISIAIFAALLLGACVGTIPPKPWFEGDADWPSVSRVKIERDGKNENIETAISISCSDESALWIYIYSHNYRDHSEPVPILYSAKDAYIEKENGERVIARSEFYARNSPTQDMSPARCKEIMFYSTLQSGAANLNQKKGGVNLRFDTTPPAPGSRWILHLGQVTIGDIRIEIPEKTIILRGREWYSRRLQ